MTPADHLNRRHALCGLGAAASLLATPWAIAQGAWPTKPVNIVVPFPPGGGTDAFARPLFAHMGKALNRQFVIDNKGGAGGTLGAGVAARAAPDGVRDALGEIADGVFEVRRGGLHRGEVE